MNWSDQFRKYRDTIHRQHAIYVNTIFIRIEKCMENCIYKEENKILNLVESISIDENSCMNCSFKFRIFNRSISCSLCCNRYCYSCIIEFHLKNAIPLIESRKKPLITSNKSIKICLNCEKIITKKLRSTAKEDNNSEKYYLKIMHLYDSMNKIINEDSRYLKEISISNEIRSFSFSKKMYLNSLKGNLSSFDLLNKSNMELQFIIKNDNQNQNTLLQSNQSCSRLLNICSCIKQKSLSHSEKIILFLSNYKF